LHCIFAVQLFFMAIMNAELTNPDYGFTVIDEKNHSMFIDITREQGGNGGGFRPMQTVLAALCGCSGVDVVSILKKQRQTYNSFKIFIDGEREKGKEPSLWEYVYIRFEFQGNVEPSKAYRASELSVTKYCSVAETLRRAGATITFRVFVNGIEVT
jgi:putative redox protein